MTQLQRRALNPGIAPHPLGAYSQALEVRPCRLLYIAGQVGLGANGHVPGGGDARGRGGASSFCDGWDGGTAWLRVSGVRGRGRNRARPAWGTRGRTFRAASGAVRVASSVGSGLV